MLCGEIQPDAWALPIIVVKDGGGATEIVAHQESGLIIEASSQAIGAGMIMLAKNPELCNKFGRAGRRFVMDHLTAQHSSARVLRIYREVLSTN